MKPRRGRPPRGDKSATERIELRVTKLERFAWEHAAEQIGLTLSEWIRARCVVRDYTAANGRRIQEQCKHEWSVDAQPRCIRCGVPR